jgi:hypothetical protein
MLLPLVLLAVGLYGFAALFLVRRAKVVSRKRAVILAWLIGFVLFVGDHVLGYLWLKWYTSTVSAATSAAFTVSSLAIENSSQSDEQRRAERGDGGGGGLPPIFPALNAAAYIFEPIRYQSAEAVMDAYNLIPSVGYSVVEVIDLNYQRLHPGGPPRVLRYSIFKRPDPRCKTFEKLPPDQLAKIQVGLAKNGLVGAEGYCIGREETQKVTARYKSETKSADAWHPRQWSLPPLRHPEWPTNPRKQRRLFLRRVGIAIFAFLTRYGLRVVKRAHFDQ